MSTSAEFWQFIDTQLRRDSGVMLLIVAESHGSSPGRAGYKMAVAEDGELMGSVGGGVMEVTLVEQAKVKSKKAKGKKAAEIVEQVHRKDVPNSSGMICSGRQSIILKQVTQNDLHTIETIIDRLEQKKSAAFEISNVSFQIIENTQDNSPFYFSKASETEFVYQEKVGYKHNLFIVGGGHCALALSELMLRLSFHISIFDDRPELNTLEKNRHANEIKVIDSYENIAGHVPSGDENYVVVMTIGYAFDEIVIRKLFDKDFKYFGVLGSKAKMKTLMKTLQDDGFDKDRLAKIHTPVGLSISSRTPEEIAISIAAEIISVKNAR